MHGENGECLFSFLLCPSLLFLARIRAEEVFGELVLFGSFRVHLPITLVAEGIDTEAGAEVTRAVGPRGANLLYHVLTGSFANRSSMRFEIMSA